jgi:hypothetical protein
MSIRHAVGQLIVDAVIGKFREISRKSASSAHSISVHRPTRNYPGDWGEDPSPMARSRTPTQSKLKIEEGSLGKIFSMVRCALRDQGTSMKRLLL